MHDYIFQAISLLDLEVPSGSQGTCQGGLRRPHQRASETKERPWSPSAPATQSFTRQRGTSRTQPGPRIISASPLTYERSVSLDPELGPQPGFTSSHQEGAGFHGDLLNPEASERVSQAPRDPVTALPLPAGACIPHGRGDTCINHSRPWGWRPYVSPGP